MPIPAPVPSGKTPATVRIFYCVCGVVWMNIPKDAICLVCHQQGKFKQVDIESPNVQETFPA